ncbi:MAG TPA: hypothetical protein VGR49_05720 [Actinomycetota bacterium]|jgi:hypothetical protein|nr:hypothetical protein [Actinomycetota bacterium]
MDRRTGWILSGSLALALIAGGTAFALARGAGDDEPLIGSALQRATAAALQHTGGGTVIETEVGDDGAAYGVEIRLDDGSVVEVSLDENFQVIGDETDDGPNDQNTGPNDD